MTETLTDIPETLAIPLWARAVERDRTQLLDTAVCAFAEHHPDAERRRSIDG